MKFSDLSGHSEIPLRFDIEIFFGCRYQRVLEAILKDAIIEFEEFVIRIKANKSLALYI